MSELFTVELYKDDSWKLQCFIGDTYEECDEWIDKHPVEDPYRYSIWCIEYDEQGNILVKWSAQISEERSAEDVDFTKKYVYYY